MINFSNMMLSGIIIFLMEAIKCLNICIKTWQDTIVEV